MSAKKPIVSVIIPVYNVEDYLRECLDSVVNQTLENIEIICVNDGSTDNSRIVLEEYQKKDPRITVIDQQNTGLSSARNVGMREAAGQYIYFLDSDDFIDPETLQETVQLADNNHLDAVVFDFEQFSASEELLKLHPFYLHSIERPILAASGVEYLRVAKDCGVYSSVVWNTLWRRAFLKENGLRFKKGILHEDMLFSFQAYMAAGRVMQIPNRFYHYRARPNSITMKQVSSENVIGAFECTKEVLKYLFQDDLEPEKEHEILRTFQVYRKYTYDLYNTLSEDEQRKIILSGETEKELFRLMTDDFEVKRLQNKTSNLQQETVRLQDALRGKQEEFDSIISSCSFRLGRMATWFPRLIRDTARRLRGKGRR